MNPRRQRRLLAWLLFAVAIVLRLLPLQRSALWGDELFSLAMATGHSLEHPAAKANPALGDFVEIRAPGPLVTYRRYLEHEHPPAGPKRVIRAVFLSDTSPPLYYLALNAWTRLAGTTDAALRLFSVAWALACLPLIWSIARRTGGHAIVLTAGVLFTFAPMSLYYSLEGRMYSLVWFLALSVVWLTLRLHYRGARPPLLVLWSTVAAAGLLTHYFFAFVLAACVLWLWLHPGRSNRLTTIAGLLVVGLAVLPWYIHLPESFAAWRVTRTWSGGPIAVGRALVATLKNPWQLLSGRGDWGGSRRFDWFLCALFVLLGMTVVLRRGVRPLVAPRRQLLWFWVAGACLGPFVFDVMRGTFTSPGLAPQYASVVPRYALAGLPAAVLLVGQLLSCLRPRVQVAMTVLILFGWMPGIRAIMTNRFRAYTSYRDVASYLVSRGQPSDLIIVHSIPSGVLGVARYTDTRTPMVAWIEELGQRRVPEDLQALISGHPRVALVKIHVRNPDQIGEPSETWLREHAQMLSRLRRRNLKIQYFAPADGPCF